MVYALVITITVGVLILLLMGGGAVLVQRAVGAAQRGEAPFGRWRWYPSPLGLLILLPIGVLLVFRFLPVLLVIPVILPFFWRGRRLAGPLLFLWNLGRQARPNKSRDDDDDIIDGESRRPDDE